MTLEGWYTLAIVLGVLVALIRNWAPPDAAMLGAALLLGIGGVIEPDEVFAGFISEGLLTVAALFVVAAALRETGALDRIGRWLLGRARTERGALLRMTPWVLGMSAFVNNTPVVAMLVPTVTNWCRQNRVSPSRMLLPVSYLAILGGTCTLIGTSTNLVVNDLMTQTDLPGLEPMSMFELSNLGVPYAIVGGLYLIFFVRRFLPDRTDLLEQLGTTTRDYLVNMRVEPPCPLVGQTVEQANLRRLPGLFLVDITRDENLITPVSPNMVIEAGDVFTFTGVVSTIIDLERIPGLVPVADEGYEARSRERRNKTLIEAVISQASPLIGKTVRDADFRARYNAAVIAVHRGRERMKGRVGDIVLRAGDTLLLQGTPHFIRAHRNNPHFLVVSGIEEARPARHDLATVSLVLMGLLIVLMSLGLPPVLVAFGVAALMVLSRSISVTLARQSIDWQTLITIGCAYAVGLALERSGVAELMGDAFGTYTPNMHPVIALGLVYIFVNVCTEMITNNAAAVLTFPFVLHIAEQLQVNPRPFVIIIAFAASASFCTPIGYQTNLMVYGPGGYRFSDFIRAGLPLTITLMLLATALIPLIWPFYP